MMQRSIPKNATRRNVRKPAINLRSNNLMRSSDNAKSAIIKMIIFTGLLSFKNFIVIRLNNLITNIMHSLIKTAD